MGVKCTTSIASDETGHAISTPRSSSVCISGYPLSGYPDLSVNFMAAKNPDILSENPAVAAVCKIV